MLDKSNGQAILAEQGKWVARLRDAARLLDQRLIALEHRMSVLEEHLSELTKANRKRDVRLTSVTDQLRVLILRFEFLAEQIGTVKKIQISRRAVPQKNSR